VDGEVSVVWLQRDHCSGRPRGVGSFQIADLSNLTEDEVKRDLLVPVIFVVAGDVRLLEHFEPQEPSNAFSAPGELISRIRGKEWIEIGVIEADSIVADSEATWLGVIGGRPQNLDLYPAFSNVIYSELVFDGLDRVRDGLEERSESVARRGSERDVTYPAHEIGFEGVFRCAWG
jgi:hypothetical protein